MLMAACVMLPTVWLPDLKALSYLGFFGVGATITVLCAVAYTYLSGSPASRAQLCRGELLHLAAVDSRPSASFCTSVHNMLPLCAHAAVAAAPLSGVDCCSASELCTSRGQQAVWRHGLRHSGVSAQAASRRARPRRRPTGARCRWCSASWRSCTRGTACSPASSAA